MSSSETSSAQSPETTIFVYGTGSHYHKQDELVFQAIQLGYSIIDTGPSDMYNEELTAKGIRKALETIPGKSPHHLHVQTKISLATRYQDDLMTPFQPSDSPLEQVRKTFERSKKRFASSGCSIQTLLLHSPLPTLDLTMQYWRAMETIVASDPDLKFLGICNATVNSVQHIHRNATIKPSIVQNSFRAQTSFDADVIEFCRLKNISYQAYGVLTSNAALLESKLVGWFAEKHHVSEAEALFVLVASHGRGAVQLLHASHSERHMAADIGCLHLVSQVDGKIMRAFEELLADICTLNHGGNSWSY
jgi:diketogulonate reductase-like aldo/keto reductase